MKNLLKHRWIKFAIIVITALVVLGFLLLKILRSVAQNQGVTEVNLPSGSEIERLALHADYVDAYQVTVEKASIPESLFVASYGGNREVARTDQEIVTEGIAPGLSFLVSYHSADGNPQYTIFSTAVFYESVLGRICFFFVRPVHGRIVPFMLSQTFQ